MVAVFLRSRLTGRARPGRLMVNQSLTGDCHPTFSDNAELRPGGDRPVDQENYHARRNADICRAWREA